MAWERLWLFGPGTKKVTGSPAKRPCFSSRASVTGFEVWAGVRRKAANVFHAKTAVEREERFIKKRSPRLWGGRCLGFLDPAV